MPILLATIAAAIIAAAVITVVLVLRRTTISIIVRKDPDMATIKERLAVLEADNVALKAQLADHDASLAGVATVDGLASVADRITAVESEIGTDPVAAPAPAAIDPTATAPFAAVQTPMAG